MADNANHGSDEVSRRRILQSTGLASTVGLAGCLGGDDDNGNGDSGNGNGNGNGDSGNGNGNGNGDSGNGNGTEQGNLYYDSYLWEIPTDIHFNPFAETLYSDHVEQIIFDRLADFSRTHNEFLPRVATEWAYEDDVLTVQIREDHTWHNGDPVTAEDIAMQFRISEYLGAPVWDYLEGIEATDEKTLEFSTVGVSESLILHSVLTTWINAPPARFNEWLDRLENASDESEEEDVLSELLEFSPKEFSADEPYTHGPCVIQNRDESTFTTTFYEDYAIADRPNFDGYRKKRKQDNQEKYAAIRTGDCDGLETFAPDEVIEGFPDHIAMIGTTDYGGSGIAFNHDHDLFGDLRVRKAIAYFINREEVGGVVYSPVDTPVEHVTGLPPALNEEWASDILDSLEQYEHNPEKGAELLEEAGYSKENGTWVDSNGDPISFSMTIETCCPNQITGYESAVTQLQQEGFEAEVNTVDGTTYYGDIWPNADFDLAQNWWGEIHPFLSLRVLMHSDGDVANASRYPQEVEVAETIGDPDSEMVTVDIQEELQTLLTAQSEEETREQTQWLAWIFNQTLPFLPVVEKQTQGFLRTDEWTYNGYENPGELESALGEDPVLGVWWQQPDALLRENAIQPKE